MLKYSMDYKNFIQSQEDRMISIETLGIDFGP